LKLLGILPNNFFTTHGIHWGAAAMVMLFSFALADRIRLLKKEKNEALSARVLEHERAEAAQNEAAQAWQSTFDAIGSCVCLLDRNGLVLRANQAALDLLGRTDKDILYEPLSSLLKEASGSVSSSPPPGFDSGLNRVESFIEFKNRWYSFRRDPICGEDESVIGSVYVMTDVTNQKELEQQLFQAQKMDAIGRLAGGVAHDFNNLLSVILSYAEFLVDSATDDDAKADAQEIVKAGRRAAALTAQLLAFSRKQVLKPSLLHPSDVINDLSKMLSRLMGENYKLSLALSPKIGRIFFPKGQLEQILVNLVVNAKDALPANGEVAIETEWLDLATSKQTTTGELPAGKYLSLRVRDSGKGMDAATVARIFEPFFTTKGPTKGTGLGLAMVYGCVRQSGGAIDVLSAKGKGTRMTVYLPQADESATASSQPPVWEKTHGKNQKVLVVEDEATVAAVIRKILSSAGYMVLEARSAEAALELLDRQAQPVDFLLTDIVMSGMTGLELGAKVAERFANMKILYMSGYGFEALSQQGIDPASIHLLAKPFTREELLGVLRGQEE
jgi:signal transduction histidine kinase